MAQEFVVVAYGNGNILREIFNAIAAGMGDSPYQTLIHISVLLAGTWATFELVFKRSLMSSVKWVGLYFFAFYVMFLPKATIQIIDRVELGKVYAVDNVPLGLAILANVTSIIGDGLTQITEQNFSLPDDLRYSHTGMVMASNLVTAASTFQITDANFQESMQSFVTQCIFYDVLLNKYTAQDLLSSNNIWQFVSDRASPARAFMYNHTVVTCRDGILSLNRDWKTAIDEAGYRYGARLFPQSKNAKTELLKYLPLSYGYLIHLSTSASDLLQQNMMVNAVQQGLVGWTARTSAPAALQSYAFNKSQQQTRMGNRTVGDMAAYWLPLLKNIFEGILYGSFIFIFLLLLFPFGLQVLRQYAYSLVWVQMWAPLYAILNLYMTFYAQQRSMGALGGMGLSLSTQSGLAQVNADMSSLAGYISMSIPLIAAGLVKGLSSVLTHVGQYVGGMAHSAATSTAMETASGNMSQGNTSFSTHNLNNTSANHFDTASRVFSGTIATQMAGGSTLSMMPDGSMVMNNQPAISNLGTTINLASAIRSSAMQQADIAYSSALSHQQAYNEAISSAKRDAFELSKHQGKSESSGENAVSSHTTNDMRALNSLSQMQENSSESHRAGRNDSAGIDRNAGIQGTAGVSGQGLGVGANVGGSATIGKSIHEKHQDSQDHTISHSNGHTTQEGYSQNYDHVFRAVQEGSYHANTDKGQRLLESISTSLDRAQQEQHMASAQFQQAESYRRIATIAEEKAVSINTNATQQFMDNLQKSGQSMRDIERVMVDHPQQAQAMADQFVQGQVSQYMQEFNQHQASSAHHIGETYHQQVNAIQTEQANKQLNPTMPSPTIEGTQPSHSQPTQPSQSPHQAAVGSENNPIRESHHTSIAPSPKVAETLYQQEKSNIESRAHQENLSLNQTISKHTLEEVKQVRAEKIRALDSSQKRATESKETISKKVGDTQKRVERAFDKHDKKKS